MTKKPNKQRGEITIKGPGGEHFTMCLTLGAIAQIEAEFSGIESLADIGDALGKAKMADLLTIFVALLNGGGHTEITRADMMSWSLDLSELMAKIMETFKAAGFDGDEDGEEEESETSGN